MSYHDKLATEITEKILSLENERRPIRAEWITHEVCTEHVSGLADNEHREFWHHGGYQHTRSMVTRCINKRIGDQEEDRGERQPVLPGFERLQSHYIVERDGDEIGVPVFELTDDEIDAKIEIYRSMAKGCQEHADELRRFKMVRTGMAATIVPAETVPA